MPEKRSITVALAGNPNAGKTTIFNNLTGARQHVGNWPGVTVEKKEGTCRQDGYDLSVVDLPGTYSLTAYSLEEVVVRDYISIDKPDVVVNIVDASNLERNLYLTTQLMELGVPVIIGLNMIDTAEKRGIHIDLDMLTELLGTPVVPMVGVRNQGTGQLKEMIVSASSREIEFRHMNVNYGREAEEEISKLEEAIGDDDGIRMEFLVKYSARWLAVKLLEEDPRVEDDIIQHASDSSIILSQVEASRHHLSSIFGEDIETIIVDNRFGFVSGIVRESVQRDHEEYETMSDRIDNILTHRIFGFPFFALFMWLMFFLTFFLGKYPMEWIEWLVTHFADFMSTVITSPTWLQSLIADGIIGGVGSVLIFMPQIFIMFICISILEDTGYMARAAFIMDRIMHWLGLHGKSFIPMVMGFGCNVPAVMATRTLESDKDRIITILINPLMSCTARLPVYALFTAAFFAGHQGTVTLSMYLLGIILAVIMAKIFRKLFFHGESEPFVMELPPYRWPTAKGTFVHMWERASMFLRKAGTIILAGSVFVWILSFFPLGTEYGGANSLAGILGRVLEPIFKPLGFDWRAAVALLFGIVAKEIVVSTYGTLLGAGEGTDISTKLQNLYTPLTAYGFMAFTLIYTPCLATVAVIKKETGSWKWAAFSVAYSFILAWLIAFAIYRLGMLFGLGG